MAFMLPDEVMDTLLTVPTLQSGYQSLSLLLLQYCPCPVLSLAVKTGAARQYPRYCQRMAFMLPDEVMATLLIVPTLQSGLFPVSSSAWQCRQVLPDNNPDIAREWP